MALPTLFWYHGDDVRSGPGTCGLIASLRQVGGTYVLSLYCLAPWPPSECMSQPTRGNWKLPDAAERRLAETQRRGFRLACHAGLGLETLLERRAMRFMGCLVPARGEWMTKLESCFITQAHARCQNFLFFIVSPRVPGMRQHCHSRSRLTVP